MQKHQNIFPVLRKIFSSADVHLEIMQFQVILPFSPVFLCHCSATSLQGKKKINVKLPHFCAQRSLEMSSYVCLATSRWLVIETGHLFLSLLFFVYSDVWLGLVHRDSSGRQLFQSCQYAWVEEREHQSALIERIWHIKPIVKSKS